MRVCVCRSRPCPVAPHFFRASVRFEHKFLHQISGRGKILYHIPYVIRKFQAGYISFIGSIVFIFNVPTAFGFGVIVNGLAQPCDWQKQLFDTAPCRLNKLTALIFFFKRKCYTAVFSNEMFYQKGENACDFCPPMSFFKGVLRFFYTERFFLRLMTRIV